MHLPHFFPALSKQASKVSMSGLSPRSASVTRLPNRPQTPEGVISMQWVPNPPQTRQMGKMLVGPARHETFLVKVVCGRRQSGCIACPFKKIGDSLPCPVSEHRIVGQWALKPAAAFATTPHDSTGSVLPPHRFPIIFSILKSMGYSLLFLPRTLSLFSSAIGKQKTSRQTKQ